MGRDNMSVVDGNLKVYGIENLRIADGSIMPRVTIGAISWSNLGKISISTLIITGTKDVAVPAANSLIIAQKIPGAWLVQINGGGHGLMYQYPFVFSKVLQTFLRL